MSEEFIPLFEGAPPESIDITTLPYDPTIQPPPHEELWGLDLLDLFEEAVEKIQHRAPTRFWASHVTRCPRAVWYAFHGIPETSTLTGFVQREAGHYFELLEESLREMVLEKINTTTISQVLGRYPRLQSAVEGALRSRRVDEIEGGFLVSRRFTSENIKDYAITQLPFLLDLGVGMPVACVVDAIVLLKDVPVIYEIKSTKGRGARRLKAAARRAGERPIYVGWIVQTALYTVALDLPAKLRIWARDDAWRTEFDLDWRKGHFCVNGHPYTINGEDPVEWARKRLSWLAEALEREEPPGRIVRKGNAEGLVLPEDYPRYEDEHYILAYDGGKPTWKGSSWCHNCGYRHLCHGEDG